jgi:hypothetical protein
VAETKLGDSLLNPLQVPTDESPGRNTPVQGVHIKQTVPQLRQNPFKLPLLLLLGYPVVTVSIEFSGLLATIVLQQ